MKKSNTPYEYIININSLQLEEKSVLIIGAGKIANEYVVALSQMGVRNISVISKTENKLKHLHDKFGTTIYSNGYELHLPKMKKKDLVIIATPIDLLLPAAQLALDHGQTNILIEKPGSLYGENLENFANKYPQRIKIAYNRLVYPNVILLKELVQKEGGITSCHFTFTEWIDTIDFNNNSSDVYRRWGISNSLHVISMVDELIGSPKEISSYKSGTLGWHPTGSIFVGGGFSKNNIPFSYHANWTSSGRWGIEVMTKENAYRLIPLEDLYVCKKNTTTWEKIPFEIAYPTVKQGIAEEIALMLDSEMESQIPLVSLKRAAEFITIAEKIFGYNGLPHGN